MIAIACDHGGYELKCVLTEYLRDHAIDYIDLGCNGGESCDYTDYALKCAEGVGGGKYEKGILICGTGVGMSIAANKVKGVRAALVHDVFTAKATRLHNDSNILAMGARVIGSGLMIEIVRAWLGTEFSGDERHIKRIAKIDEIEEKYFK